ncbi:MAG TPA: ubiquinol-cytochrome c reductase iron-sulfur subunit [Bacteroidetes bacterium]|nr:ubiquinol-cytochrome c reductase iron-sulfur subunit [Bacteroidota bacterium]
MVNSHHYLPYKLSDQKYNRRNFFRLTGSAVLLGGIYLWSKLVGSEKQLLQKRKITVPFNPNREIQFAGEYIIVNNNDEISVFSARCTHLGCLLNQENNGRIICPCHGSVFNENGMPEKGPAIKPLKRLPFHFNSQTNRITIQVRG